MARSRVPKGFAQVRDDLGEHITNDELVERIFGLPEVKAILPKAGE